MTNLIKSINDSLKPKDPVTEAMKEVDQTHLEDDQVEMLADYVKEMVDHAKKQGIDKDLEEVAMMALEDVAGFETAPERILAATAAKIVKAYLAKFGNA